jgi:hypothetical protein
MVQERKKTIPSWLVAATAVLLAAAAVYAHYRWDPWGFYWKVSPEETALRMQVVQTAESYLGCKEEDGSHEKIIDLYNSQDPLPVGYAVQYTDSWCATFGSTVAIQCGLTNIIPTECSCERQINLFRDMGCWEEKDDYIPLPGDYIFYTLKNPSMDDSTAWSDHVGIVVGTWHGFIKVIEGNNGGTVKYRVIPVDDPRIRGFALPDYEMLL